MSRGNDLHALEVGRMRTFGWVVLVVLAAGYFYNQTAMKSRVERADPQQAPVQTATTEAVAAETRPERRPEPLLVAESVYAPYTKKFYPKMFSEWGVAGVKKIDRLRKLAAEKAAESWDCDGVEISEYSANRSQPKSSIVIFVDCSNSHRFYFSEAELAESARPAVSERQKGLEMSPDQVRDVCDDAVKSSGRFSEGFSMRLFSRDPRFVEANGRWVMEYVPPTDETDRGSPKWATCILIPGLGPTLDYGYVSK